MKKHQDILIILQLDNLIKISHTTKYITTIEKWIDIPYPEGFSPENSLVFARDTGDTLNAIAHIKLSNTKKQFSIWEISNRVNKSSMVEFIFIKINFL